MKKILFTIIFCTISGVTIFAQNVKRPDSYNYQRGIEAIQEEKMGDALEYFNKVISDNPKSGYPYMWVSYIYLKNEQYGQALNAANMAIKYLPNQEQITRIMNLYLAIKEMFLKEQ